MFREVAVDEADVRRFLEAVFVTYGYDLRGYHVRSIHRRVAAALARSGLPTLAALERAVVTDANVFARVIDDLTVRVSEPFRDPEFFRAFRASVVPLLRTYPSLKFWHAGCASGEEVYSAAIVLEEERLYDRAQIYATDLNPHAVEAAKQGIYASHDVTTLATNHAAAGGLRPESSYVTSAYAYVAFRERLKKNVLFFQHDLVNDRVFGEMQVVFCRNVLLYFGEELRRRVLEKIHESLCPGGFLCLGSAERIGPATRGSFTVFDSRANIYRKRD